MSSGSLDILKNRVQSALEETKALRAENERLKDRLEAILAGEPTAVTQHSGQPASNRFEGNIFDTQDIRRRLQALVARLRRLEEDLDAYAR